MNTADYSGVIPVTRTAVECCPGYRLSPQDLCAPICTSGCLRSSCIAPEVCATRQNPTSPKPLRDKPSTSLTLKDNYLQIEQSTKQASVSRNITTQTTPIVTSTNHSPVIIQQGYNSSISTTVSYIATLGESIPITSPSPISSIGRPAQEEAGGNTDRQDTTTAKDKTTRKSAVMNHQNHDEDILLTQERNIKHNLDSRTIMKTDMKKASTVRPTQGQGHRDLVADPSNATARRDPLKYSTSDNDTTYSHVHLSDRFVYSVGISVGVMFAIIMVTLVITKHQHYLQGVDPKRGSKKCKAAHQDEEQETSLRVVRCQVTREVTNQPCINSTITVYNFPPPINAFDVPLRPPPRPFGDYDFPSPMVENVYDEIPAHRDEMCTCPGLS